MQHLRTFEYSKLAINHGLFAVPVFITATYSQENFVADLLPPSLSGLRRIALREMIERKSFSYVKYFQMHSRLLNLSVGNELG